MNASGYALSQVPVLVPTDHDYSGTLGQISISDQASTAALLELVRVEKYKEELSREDERTIEAVDLTTAATLVTAANLNRLGISFFNNSQSRIFVGDSDVSTSKMLLRLDPGSFMRLPSDDSIFEFYAMASADAPLSFAEYLHDPSKDLFAPPAPPVPPVPPDLSLIPQTILASATTLSVGAGTTVTYTSPPAVRGQTVPIQIVSTDNQNTYYSGTTAVPADGVQARTVANLTSIGVPVGATIYMIQGAGADAVRTPAISVVA